MKLKLQGNKHIFIPKKRMVTIYDEIKEKTSHDKKAENIKKDDIIVLVDESSAKGLVDAIIKKIEKSGNPKIIEVVTYQNLWIEALKSGMEKENHSREKVSDLLDVYGCRRTSAAIYQWLNGRVVGPKNERKVVKAIGKIYSDDALLNNINKVVKSIKRLRKLHGRIKRRVKYLATHRVKSTSEEDEIVDEELDLYLSDFKDIVKLEKIEKVLGEEQVNSYKANRILYGGNGNEK